jgi:hypothetical protein
MGSAYGRAPCCSLLELLVQPPQQFAIIQLRTFLTAGPAAELNVSPVFELDLSGEGGFVVVRPDALAANYADPGAVVDVAARRVNTPL